MNDFTTKQRILLLLFVAFGVRAVVFFFVHPYEGIFQIPFQELEPYQDFKLLYMKEVENFLNGKLPYKDFFHAYPPLFLYTLSLIAFFGPPLWASALPIVAYDALTILPVFLIARRLIDETRASLIAIVASLTPMVLFYNSVLWLNPPPSTFFMLISAYFLLRGNIRLSAITLALATGYKQTSVVLFPAMLIGAYRFGSKRSTAEFFLIFTLIGFIISVPYIIEFPLIYLWSLGVPGIPTPEMYGPPSEEWKYDISQPINFLTYFGVFG
ncbi:MAG: glycosyltransferase family 39 protein, partial [Nitrososphaerota archaeon]